MAQYEIVFTEKIKQEILLEEILAEGHTVADMVTLGNTDTISTKTMKIDTDALQTEIDAIIADHDYDLAVVKLNGRKKRQVEVPFTDNDLDGTVLEHKHYFNHGFVQCILFDNLDMGRAVPDNSIEVVDQDTVRLDLGIYAPPVLGLPGTWRAVFKNTGID